MVAITRYGPILDPAIEVVKELTHHSKADIYFPLHEEAAGMAVDINRLLIRLYPYIDSEIYTPGRMPLVVHGNQDPKARQFRIRYVFRKMPFEMPNPDEFLGYPYGTIIDLDDEGKHQVDYDTQVSSTAKNTPERYTTFQKSPVIIELENNRIQLPEERRAITIAFGYQSVSSFTVNTFFQQFTPVGEFRKSQIDKVGYNYPVSSKDRHELDHNSWSFFSLPVFWDSWSQYSSVAFNKLSNNRSYEEAAKGYSVDLDKILRHAQKAEPTVVDTLRALSEGRNLGEVADAVKCPYEYRGIYLRKLLSSIRWLCNPGSLNDSQKMTYLRELADSCDRYGFRITPEGLAEI